MKPLEIRYGDSTLKGSIPDDWRLTILAPEGMTSLDDPAAALRKAIDNPVDSPSLSEVLAGGGDLVIVVPDRTRVACSDIVVPVLLDGANAAGIDDGSITVLFGGGTHAGHTPEEREKLVGNETAKRVRLVDHDADADDLVRVGTTPAGTPVIINRLAAEADRLIVTGVAQFHYFAGFGGGRKGVLPGISGRESIVRNHSFTLSPNGGRNPACLTAHLDGNPLSEDMVEAARIVSPDFLVNLVLNGERRISSVHAGHWEKAHRQACEVVKSRFSVPIDERADVVIVTPGGYPKDINYIQAHKALDNAFYAVRPGGVIVLAAECRDGIGSDIMREYLAIETIEAHEKRLKEQFQITGHTALAHRLKARAVTVLMITAMSDEDVSLLGVQRAPDIDEALTIAAKSLPDTPRAYVMPEGYNTLPTT